MKLAKLQTSEIRKVTIIENEAEKDVVESKNFQLFDENDKAVGNVFSHKGGFSINLQLTNAPENTAEDTLVLIKSLFA